ncbi:iron complex transport system permease protein [Mesorhizobium soli]|uniref:FecCD family ABC transporter permease n=1 Tax=Pseudaminobacter soli (ex Li et al. 2025) TaxID=1295366 RepID=UPI002475FAD2|nr:iron ABC transporter permease [Mesorhizobium soli]MDH6232372.1 iron complex transport system permease protein [Mesorhizobium soli]
MTRQAATQARAASGPKRRALPAMALPALALVVLVLVSLAIGKYDVSPGEVATVIAAKITGAQSGLSATVETMVWHVRLPRVLAGLLIGAALSAAGAVYQGLFRNPLVSPDILGVSAGASLGAVAGIFLSLPVIAIQGLSFLGGLGAVALVYSIGFVARGRDPTLTLVLAGVAVGALLGACISLLKVLADPYNQLPAITFWLLGSLASITQGDLLSILPAMVLGLLPMVLLRWRMNLMSLDDEEARALGVETGRYRWIFIASATLLTASAVSVSGVVGWIGLLVPHVARMLVGPDFSRLLPASLMLGAAYLIGVDTLARSIAAIEVPLGILTAAIGAPFFLYILITARRGWQ